jgi:hypothetical protein
MATLIDERLPEDVETEQEEVSQIQEEPQVEDTPQEEDEIPEKYQGKSTAEIVRMHQEAEKLLGRQSSEVGELRSVVDNYIQTQLDTNTPATQEPEEDIDFFSDPDKAVERAIKNHPLLRIILQSKLLKHKLSSTRSKQRSLTCNNVILTCKRFYKMVSLLSGLRDQRFVHSSLHRQTRSTITKLLMNSSLRGKNVNR